MQGDCDLEVACSAKAFRDVAESAEKQKRVLGLDTEVLSADQFRERHFDFPKLCGWPTAAG